LRRILSDLKTHLKSNFEWSKDGVIMLLLAVLIFVNYHFELEEKLLSNLDPWLYLGYFHLLYPAVYYATVWIKCRSKITAKFTSLSALYILALSVSSGFIFFKTWFADYPVYEEYYLRNIAANAQGSIIIFLVLVLVYFGIERRQLPNFYGFSLKHNFKPYLILILFMAPLIVGATSLPGFLDTYPSLKVWKYDEVFGMTHTQMASLFELVYLSDFIRVEALFRGALVIGLARFLGKDTIITMAALYCVLHFNKPLGETISSFFGGYLLGTIAYYQQNIVGGCIVHVGIAGLMDLVAAIAWSMM